MTHGSGMNTWHIFFFLPLDIFQNDYRAKRWIFSGWRLFSKDNPTGGRTYRPRSDWKRLTWAEESSFSRLWTSYWLVEASDLFEMLFVFFRLPSDTDAEIVNLIVITNSSSRTGGEENAEHETVQTTKCWNSHDRITLVACFGRTPLFCFLLLLPRKSSSSSIEPGVVGDGESWPESRRRIISTQFHVAWGVWEQAVHLTGEKVIFTRRRTRVGADLAERSRSVHYSRTARRRILMVDWHGVAALLHELVLSYRKIVWMVRI